MYEISGKPLHFKINEFEQKDSWHYNWITESETDPVCGKCAHDLSWMTLLYSSEKKSCFICGKKTNNRTTWPKTHTKFHVQNSKKLINLKNL